MKASKFYNISLETQHELRSLLSVTILLFTVFLASHFEVDLVNLSGFNTLSLALYWHSLPVLY